MKKLLFTTLFLLIILFGCTGDYDERKFDIVTDAIYLQGGFAQMERTQIKTINKTFVVQGNPVLQLNDSITGGFSGNKLMYIIDNRGRKYRVN